MARSITKGSGGGRINSPGLHALLENLIDYAGLFPPASLSIDTAIANYRRYCAGEHAWILGRFVVSASHVPDVDLPFAVLSETDHPRAQAIESKQVISTPKPTYCEVSLDRLDAVAQAGSYGKLRTGGITPDAIPPVEAVLSYIAASAERRLPFKATAGLHHPVRSVHPLTYEEGSPRAMMHGFINVFLAAAFAWYGHRNIQPILTETDPAAFKFDDRACWRDLSLSVEQIAGARANFAHSFGSCSFEEPIQDLQLLGFL